MFVSVSKGVCMYVVCVCVGGGGYGVREGVCVCARCTCKVSQSSPSGHSASSQVMRRHLVEAEAK